jgi:hypothetical protein
MSGVVAFLRRNIVLVVSLPTLVAIHYAWYNLQWNDIFVDKQSREHTKILGIPIVRSDHTVKDTHKD